MLFRASGKKMSADNELRACAVRRYPAASRLCRSGCGLNYVRHTTHMSPAARIPDQVATAILANRKHFHELNAKAKARNPNIGFVTKPLSLDQELEFWNISDDEALEEFLVEDLLGGLYGNENIDWAKMPVGYEPLLLVLEFERHCAFEGWTAVSNKGEDEMREIIAAYRELGLGDEAAALEAVTAASR